MKMRALVLTFIMVLALSSCGSDIEVNYANIELGNVEDIYEEETGEWYRQNAPKGLWQVNIENFSNNEKVKLIEDLCYFELPESIELHKGFSFALDSEMALFSGTATMPYSNYKELVVELLKNPHWKKGTDIDYQRNENGDYFLLNGVRWYSQYLEGKNSDDFYYFKRHAGPYFPKDNNVHLKTQSVVIIPEENKNICILAFYCTSENFTNKQGDIYGIAWEKEDRVRRNERLTQANLSRQ